MYNTNTNDLFSIPGEAAYVIVCNNMLTLMPVRHGSVVSRSASLSM